MGESAAAPQTRRGASATTAVRGGRARRCLVVLLVVVACPSALLSVAVVWAQEVLLDTDRYVATVAPIIKDPAVTQSLGSFTADKVVEAVGLQGRLTQELRSRLSRRIQSSLRTHEASAAWTSVNRFTHTQLVAVLRGDSGRITSGRETVTLDLMPFISLGVTALGDVLPSSIASNLKLPRLDPSASSYQQRVQLAAAVGRPLTSNFGRVTLLGGRHLEEAQRGVRLFDLLSRALAGLTVLFVGLAVALSPQRRRTLIYLGVGFVAVVVIARLLISRLERPILRSFEAGDLSPALRTAVTAFRGSLATYTMWLLLGGAVIAAVAYLAGPPVWLARLFGGKQTAAGGRS